MLTSSPTNNLTTDHKNIYHSQISSKTIASFSKTKSKLSPLKKDQIIYRSTKLPPQQIQRISQEKYKIAMKHMDKFNKYQEDVKIRKLMQNQLIDPQCTFKPKINLSKKYINQSPRYMITSYTERYSNQKNTTNPQKIDFESTLRNQRMNQKMRKIDNLLEYCRQGRSRRQKTKGSQLLQKLRRQNKKRAIKNFNRTIQVEDDQSSPRYSSNLFGKEQGTPKFIKKKSHDKNYFKQNSPLFDHQRNKYLKDSKHQKGTTLQKKPRTQTVEIHQQPFSPTISILRTSFNQSNLNIEIPQTEISFEDQNENNQSFQSIEDAVRRFHDEIRSFKDVSVKLESILQQKRPERKVVNPV